MRPVPIYRAPRSLAGGLACLIACAAGCGDSGDGGDAEASDAARPDAIGSQNHLGETCSAAAPCPADPPHQCVYLTVGNPDVGYCSPVCATDQDCEDGYAGPPTGQLNCFVPDQPDACSIVCETGDDCPGELACVATGGPVSVCTTR